MRRCHTLPTPLFEEAILKELKKPTGKLTEADLKKVTRLNFNGNHPAEVKGLEKLTKLTTLYLVGNQLTDVKGLEKLPRLKWLSLYNNPDLTRLRLMNCENHCLIAKSPPSPRSNRPHSSP